MLNEWVVCSVPTAERWQRNVEELRWTHNKHYTNGTARTRHTIESNVIIIIIIIIDIVDVPVVFDAAAAAAAAPHSAIHVSVYLYLYLSNSRMTETHGPMASSRRAWEVNSDTTKRARRREKEMCVDGWCSQHKHHQISNRKTDAEHKRH